MKQNIIALVIFIAFVGGVFGVAYHVSDDQLPITSYQHPEYGSTQYRQTAHSDNNSSLSVIDVHTPTIHHQSIGTTPTSQTPSISQNSGGGSIYTSSGSIEKSYGSGVGANSQNSAHTTTTSTSSVAHGGVSGNMPTLRQQTTISTAAQNTQIADNTLLQEEQNYTLESAGKPDDPFMNPIGDAPLWLIICALTIYIAATKRRKA